MPALNPPQTGTGSASMPAYVPGLYGLKTGLTASLTTGTSGNKAGSNVGLTTTNLTSAIERLDLGLTFSPTNGRTFCVDVYVGGVKVVTDLPFQSGNNTIPGIKPLFLHAASGSAVDFNAAANVNTLTLFACPLGYTADVTEPVTIIEPIGPVGAGASYTSTTGTLVKVPNGSATSGWTCINPTGATANAYKRLYPFVGANGDYTGRGTLTGVLELAYADDAIQTNLTSLNVQQPISFTSIFLYSLDLASIPCVVPTGKYLYAKITLSGNANKTTGATTDGEPFNVQIHGGR